MFKRLASEVDGLWLMPDNRVLSPAVLRELLSYASSHGVGVLAFNESLLSWGALLSASSLPADVAETVRSVLDQVVAGQTQSLPAMTPLSVLTLRINPGAGRSAYGGGEAREGGVSPAEPAAQPTLAQPRHRVLGAARVAVVGLAVGRTLDVQIVINNNLSTGRAVGRRAQRPQGAAFHSDGGEAASKWSAFSRSIEWCASPGTGATAALLAIATPVNGRAAQSARGKKQSPSRGTRARNHRSC